MDVSEPLNRWRVDKLPFSGSQLDEPMNGIADFMEFLRHCSLDGAAIALQ